jgi:hypothetical protein
MLALQKTIFTKDLAEIANENTATDEHPKAH